MAITLQLAKVSLSVLEQCKWNKQALDDVISFRHPENDYLDLNWAGTGLQTLFQESYQSPEAIESLALALEGDHIVNPQWEIQPLKYAVYSPITYNDLEDVYSIAQQLFKVNQQAVIACLPEEIEKANQLVKLEFTVHPKHVYREALEKLVLFYQEAAKQNMAIITWWD